MVAAQKILPGTGRGTRRSLAEGLAGPARRCAGPSTALRAVPLPRRGRIRG